MEPESTWYRVSVKSKPPREITALVIVYTAIWKVCCDIMFCVFSGAGSRMLVKSEFRDSLDGIIAGQATDLDLQCVADWPEEIIISINLLKQVPPRLVQKLEDGTVAS